MKTINLLDVDYYRNLLADDPTAFLNVIKKNNFIILLGNELLHLAREVKEVIWSSDEENQPVLMAKYIVAVGRDRTKYEMRIGTSNSREIASVIMNFTLTWETWDCDDPRIQNSIAKKFHELYLKSIRLEEEAELKLIEEEDALLNIQSVGRRQFFFHTYEKPLTQFIIISLLCKMMKVHKRLTKLIEETPIFKARLNLINPNQLRLSNDTNTLGVHEPPAADNNSNNYN